MQRKSQVSHVYTGTPRNTALTAGNRRARGRSIARGTRSPRKAGMTGGGKHVKRGTGARVTCGAGAGPPARGRRETRGNGGWGTHGAVVGASWGTWKREVGAAGGAGWSSWTRVDTGRESAKSTRTGVAAWRAARISSLS